MKKKPVFIAFSTQKGGVGKTTFTVLTASYLHYACGYNLIVVDCDYPQFSINAMRQRDAQGVDRNPALQELAAAQFSELQKPTYTILVPRQRQPWIRLGNIWRRTSRIRISSFLTCPEPSTMTVC